MYVCWYKLVTDFVFPSLTHVATVYMTRISVQILRKSLWVVDHKAYDMSPNPCSDNRQCWILRFLATWQVMTLGRGHRCRSRQIYGGAKKFCPDSPKLARKLLQNKWLPIKKALHVNSGAIILDSKHVWRHFFQIFREFQKVLRNFSWILWDFHQIKTFAGAFAPPAPPPPTPVCVMDASFEFWNLNFSIFTMWILRHFPSSKFFCGQIVWSEAAQTEAPSAQKL